MIILEGPDGGGKTTLAARICENLGLKMGQRATDNRDELYKVTRFDSYKALFHELMCMEPPLVWDRLGPWSDPIYSKAQGRPCEFTPKELYLWRVIVRNLRIPVIFCMPPIDLARANANKDRQMKGVLKNYELIYEEYEKAYSAYFMPTVYIYDYTYHSYNLLLTKIHQFLDERKERELCSSSTPATSALVRTLVGGLPSSSLT